MDPAPSVLTPQRIATEAFTDAAASLAVEAIAAPVHDTSDLESVIAAQAREPNSGLIVIADAFTVAYRVEITSLAARYRLPAIYPFRLFVDVGGLLSYGVDLTDNFRTAATYVVVTGGAIKGVRLITAAVSPCSGSFEAIQ